MNPTELPITWKIAARIFFSIMWRSFVFGALSGIAIFIFTFLSSLLIGVVGADNPTLKGICLLIDLIIYVALGIFAMIAPIKMVVGKDFGDYKLVLIKKEGDNPTS